MEQHKEALFHDGSSQFCKYNEKSDTYTVAQSGTYTFTVKDLLYNKEYKKTVEVTVEKQDKTELYTRTFELEQVVSAKRNNYILN